ALRNEPGVTPSRLTAAPRTLKQKTVGSSVKLLPTVVRPGWLTEPAGVSRSSGGGHRDRPPLLPPPLLPQPERLRVLQRGQPPQPPAARVLLPSLPSFPRSPALQAPPLPLPAGLSLRLRFRPRVQRRQVLQQVLRRQER